MVRETCAAHRLMSGKHSAVVTGGHGNTGKRGLGRCACHARPQKHGKTWPGTLCMSHAATKTRENVAWDVVHVMRDHENTGKRGLG